MLKILILGKIKKTEDGYASPIDIGTGVDARTHWFPISLPSNYDSEHSEPLPIDGFENGYWVYRDRFIRVEAPKASTGPNSFCVLNMLFFEKNGL